MDNFRKKPSISGDIAKHRIVAVYDRRTLDQAVKILHRYFVLGLDAKIRRGEGGKYVSFIVLATSNELLLFDVPAIQCIPYFKWHEWTPLARILNEPNITKVGYGMSTKQQLIKDVLGGTFLGGVIDMKEAFRAIELTEPEVIAPTSSSCEGLRALEKICYNLLDKQIPADLCEPAEGIMLDEQGQMAVVAEAFIVFHAYVELERRVRPRHLQRMIYDLLKEPDLDDYLKLSVPWSAVQLVETLDAYLDAVECLKSCSVLGFDSEWKPTRVPGGGGGRMALLQVASDDKIFLFDVLKLQRFLTYGDWALLKSIFTDPNILKLGFDTRDDSKLLREFMGPVEMESVRDLALVMRALEKLRPEHMQPSGRLFPVVRGLSRLCNILLGRPLNKSKKLSMTNWERRPLARVFLEYAALDAHCLVLCWRELLGRLGEARAAELIDISVIAYNVETEALRSQLTNSNINNNNSHQQQQ